MSSFPWLTVIGAIPLVGALAVAAIPGASDPGDTATQASRDLLVKRVALLVSLVTLGMTVAMAVKFSSRAGPLSSSFRSTSGFRSSGCTTRSAWTVSRWC